MPSVDFYRGAKRAREARADLGLDTSAPLTCLLAVVEERAELPVVVASLQDGIAGACVPLGTRRLLFVNGGEAPVRQRFTLAHELGHVRCGHDGTLAVDTFKTLAGGTTSPLEVQANAFAAEFLVPKVAVEEVTKHLEGELSLDALTMVAASYGTSAIMMLFRFRQLSVIPEETCHALRLQLDENAHFEAIERLELTTHADGLSAIDALPYLSPALEGTTLAAVLGGEAASEPALAGAISRLLL